MKLTPVLLYINQESILLTIRLYIINFENGIARPLQTNSGIDQCNYGTFNAEYFCLLPYLRPWVFSGGKYYF